MSLIRWPFRLLDRVRQQQRAVDRVSQGYRCGNITFESSYNGRNGSCGLAAAGHNGPYGQANSDYPIQVGHAGSVLEIGNGEGQRGHLNVHTPQSDYARIQAVDHFGHRHTLSLKTRFGRSCRAFVNAWRGS